MKKHNNLHPRRLVSAFISVFLLISIVSSLSSCYAVKLQKEAEDGSIDLLPSFNYNCKELTVSNKKVTDVPSGFKGIYTLEDLDSIRDSSDRKYILMNDLSFSESDFAKGGAFEGGWVPIPDFYGIFNGNGHVISNLVINTEGVEYAGLFGKASVGSHDSMTSDGTREPAPFREGFIYNLGLNNVKAEVKKNLINQESKGITLGAIVGSGVNIAGCYAENVDFTINATGSSYGSASADSQSVVNVGLLCGRAHLIDSCYATGKVTVTDSKGALTGENLKSNGVTLGSLSSFAFACVSSCGSVQVTVNGNQAQLPLLGYTTFIPVLSKSEYIENIINLIKQNSENGRDARTFMAFFMYLNIREDLKDFYINSVDTNSKFYILEPAITEREVIRLEEFCTKYAYTKEVMIKNNREMGIKSGEMSCYTTEQGKTYEQSYFNNFDFNNIWVMKDGVPKLKIFG